MRTFAQRFEYYPSREAYAALFPVTNRTESDAIDSNTLVINVRGREVLSDAHQDYGPVPVDFFSQVAERTGLTPVIVGQLGDNAYSEEIRRRLPAV